VKLRGAVGLEGDSRKGRGEGKREEEREGIEYMQI
jgi:hypothetical protein